MKKNKNVEKQKCGKNDKESTLHISAAVVTDIMQHIHPPKEQKDKYAKKKIVERLNLKSNERWLIVDSQIFSANEYKKNVLLSGFQVFLPKCENNLFCIICNGTVSKKLQQLFEHLHLSNHANTFENISKDEHKLYLAKQYIQHASEAFVLCLCCKKKIINNHEVTNAHIKSKEHKTEHKKLHETVSYDCKLALKRLEYCSYKMERFACALCSISFSFKVMFLEHVIKHIDDGIKNAVFDFCITCASLWWGYTTTFEIHCRDRTHNYLKISHDFSPRNIPADVIKLLRNIKTTTNNLLEMANSTLKSKKQEKIVKSLKKVLLPYIPHMKIYPFGSRKNGLGLPDSDIDIFIDCGVDNNEVNQKQVQEKEQYLQMIYNILYHQTQDWKCLQIILNARIPIIKLLHLSTSLHCDISVKSALSVENTKLISSYNTAYPPCRKLILFLKKWWSLCNISYGQPITSYGLSCLVIFYLQLKVGLPSVATLIKEHGKSKKTGVWETGVAYPNCDKVLSVDFNDLLRGFFDYYANFDYINLVVCPLMGYAVRKKHFTQPQQLPKEMAPYKLSLTKSNPYHFRIDSLMCIQDPFDLAKNITAGVRNIVLLHFKEYCSKSALLLNISEP